MLSENQWVYSPIWNKFQEKDRWDRKTYETKMALKKDGREIDTISAFNGLGVLTSREKSDTSDKCSTMAKKALKHPKRPKWPKVPKK